MDNYCIFAPDMTNPMTLADIQQESLRVLDEFHRFCISHGLKYSLAYGTLIGAIRHQGFIPWDDDIDVMMPRPDYEKLLNLYKDNEDYQLLFLGKKHCALTYARLCDMTRTDVISKSPWVEGKSGVWIDIFPIDAAPDCIEQTTKRYLKCHDMYRDLLARRRTQRYRMSARMMDKFKYAYHLLRGKTHAEQYAKRLCLLCSSIPYGSTGRVIDFASPIGRKVFSYNSSDMEDYVDVKFCGRTYKAVANYDSMLRVQYGDYMALPPENQRTPGHSGHVMKWKQ